MAPSTFHYSNIRKTMHSVVRQLEQAGYLDEAKAMVSLTHIIAARIETPDISSKWGVEYLLNCMTHHAALTDYMNQDARKK